VSDATEPSSPLTSPPPISPPLHNLDQPSRSRPAWRCLDDSGRDDQDGHRGADSSSIGGMLVAPVDLGKNRLEGKLGVKRKAIADPANHLRPAKSTRGLRRATTSKHEGQSVANDIAARPPVSGASPYKATYTAPKWKVCSEP
jgi:hypothetical protein